MTKSCSRWKASATPRAYVVYRDLLLVKQEEERPPRAAHDRGSAELGANPGTIFLGLRDGAPIFGMGIAPAAAEKLIGRDDVAVTELRGMAMQGMMPPEQLSAIAMAKSMVSWHQRHGFCANCGTRTGMRKAAGSANARAARPSIFRAPIRS